MSEGTLDKGVYDTTAVFVRAFAGGVEAESKVCGFNEDLGGEAVFVAVYQCVENLTVDPSSGQLQTAELQTLDADPPINETGYVKEAVSKLRDGKAVGICNISVELLEAGGEAMIRGLHAVLTAVWHSGTIPPD